MSVPTFTEEDAKNLVGVAQSAPLQNLHAAKAVSDLLQRFAEWHTYVLAQGIADSKPGAAAP